MLPTGPKRLPWLHVFPVYPGKHLHLLGPTHSPCLQPCAHWAGKTISVEKQQQQYGFLGFGVFIKPHFSDTKCRLVVFQCLCGIKIANNTLPQVNQVISDFSIYVFIHKTTLNLIIIKRAYLHTVLYYFSSSHSNTPVSCHSDTPPPGFQWGLVGSVWVEKVGFNCQQLVNRHKITIILSDILLKKQQQQRKRNLNNANEAFSSDPLSVKRVPCGATASCSYRWKQNN